MPHSDICECGRDATEPGFIVINGRLYRDGLCDVCRDEPVEELNELLEASPEVDEHTRLEVIREALIHSDRGAPDDPLDEEVSDWAMTKAGVPREDRLSILDSLGL